MDSLNSPILSDRTSSGKYFLALNYVHNRNSQKWEYDVHKKYPSLCIDNLPEFIDILMTNDSYKRRLAFENIDDIIICECLRHGIYQSPQQLVDISKLFEQEYFTLSEEIKKRIYNNITIIISKIGLHLVAAFMPFILLEDKASVVSRATIDYVSMGSLINNNPMTRPLDIIELLNNNLARNPAGLFGGLLITGDPRVCKLLEPLRFSIQDQHIPEIVRLSSGFAYKCLLEFYLDWIEELIEEQDISSQAKLGHLVAGIYRIIKNNKHSYILDGYRPFPAIATGKPGWVDMVKVDKKLFYSNIASRLYKLERRERIPKLIPHLIRACQLSPNTPSQDIGIMN